MCSDSFQVSIVVGWRADSPISYLGIFRERGIFSESSVVICSQIIGSFLFSWSLRRLKSRWGHQFRFAMLIITKFERCKIYICLPFIFTIDRIENCECSIEELMNKWMKVSIYYKTSTIILDNIVTIIFQKTINLLCQNHGKCLQFLLRIYYILLEVVLYIWIYK